MKRRGEVVTAPQSESRGCRFQFRYGQRPSSSRLRLREVGSESCPSSDEAENPGPVYYRRVHVKDPTETENVPIFFLHEIPPTFKDKLVTMYNLSQPFL